MHRATKQLQAAKYLEALFFFKSPGFKASYVKRQHLPPYLQLPALPPPRMELCRKPGPLPPHTFLTTGEGAKLSIPRLCFYTSPIIGPTGAKTLNSLAEAGRHWRPSPRKSGDNTWTRSALPPLPTGPLNPFCCPPSYQYPQNHSYNGSLWLINVKMRSHF